MFGHLAGNVGGREKPCARRGIRILRPAARLDSRWALGQDFWNQTQEGEALLTFKKILVPMDDSAHSKSAFRYALGLAQTQGAYVALLHCYEHIPMLIGGAARQEVVDTHVKEAERLLAPYARQLGELGREPALVIREGSPSEAILQEVEAGGYDLVVMGSRGLSGLEGAIMGSTAHRILAESPVPVLVAR